eukprot:gene11632-13582_t
MTQRLEVFMVSVESRDRQSLVQRVGSIESYLKSIPEDTDLKDLCYTATVCTRHYENRVAFLCRSIDDLRESISRYLKQSPTAVITKDKSIIQYTVSTRRLGYLCSCEGQYMLEMGKDFWQSHPVYQKTFNECDRIFRKFGGFSPIDLVYVKKVDLTYEELYRMPTLNCIYTSIIEVYKSYGVEPSFTLPYCVGHKLAFYASGHEITFMKPNVPVYYSSKQIDHTNYKEISSSKFWGWMLREELYFNDAVKLVLQKEPDCDAFLEIAPYPIIGGILRRTLYEKGKTNHIVLPSMMHEAENNFDTLFSTLAKLSVGGYPVKWDVAYPHDQHTIVQGYVLIQSNL